MSDAVVIEDEFGPYIGDTALAAYKVLRRHCIHQPDQAWPAVATIAFYIRRSKPTVLKAIAALEQVGLVRVERTKGKGQMRNRNRYYLLPIEGARDRLRALLADGTLKLTDEQLAYVEEVGGPRVMRLHVVKPVDDVVNEVDNASSKTALPRSKAVLPESESDSLLQEDSDSLCTAQEAVQVADETRSDLQPPPASAPPQTAQAPLFTDAASRVPPPQPTPKTRRPKPVTPRSEIEDALAAVGWPGQPAKEVWALYGGLIRRYAKEIDEANASLEVAITGVEIRDKCAPGRLWYRTYLALDDQRQPTKHPTPGAVRKWLRNLENMIVAVDGVSRTPPPPAPPVIWSSPTPPPEPVSADVRRAARQQAWKEMVRDRPSQQPSQPSATRQDRPAAEQRSP